MKIPFSILLILLSFIYAEGQTTPEKSSSGVSSDSIIVHPDSVYTEVSEPAQFPGGMEEFYYFLQRKIIYPRFALDKGIQGKVIIGFVVDKEGYVREVKLEQGVHELLDQEALRVVKLFPNFTPAKLNGQNVHYKTSIPIVFKSVGSPRKSKKSK